MRAINTRTVTPLTKYKHKHQNGKRGRTQRSTHELLNTETYCARVQNVRPLYLDSSKGTHESCGGSKTKDCQKQTFALVPGLVPSEKRSHLRVDL